MKITPELLAAWRAVTEAATPGPWKAYHGKYWSAAEDSEDREIGTFPADEHGDACSDFIAAARTAMPALISEVERLRAENERLEAELDSLEHVCTGRDP